MRISGLKRSAVVATGIILAGIHAMSIGDTAVPVNLALHRPSSSSSNENDDHSTAKANDGNPESSWHADDEPEGVPDWWQVDLGKPSDVATCEITWPYDGMNYRYRVEGSADQKKWSVLSDQTQTKSRAAVQRLDLPNARGIRFVRITITGFDSGCLAGISEVKVFSSAQAHP
ncbi:MAG: hypothetical protein JWM57_702 [Phycisphaerales bacterium]|nr:hypothetical protein [Phycisphaerales bacterium]